MADEFYSIRDGQIPLILTSQPEGGFTVTSPLLPELLTEGETVEEGLENAEDAFGAVVELYHDLGKPLPTIPPNPR
jgi:antitoxin HicB